MALTDEGLYSDTRYLDDEFDKLPANLRKDFTGRHRQYKLANGYWLSAVNAPALHIYEFAWEIAVLRNGHLCYSSPLTEDVAVFMTDDEANEFIHKAIAWAYTQTEKADE